MAVNAFYCCVTDAGACQLGVVWLADSFRNCMQDWLLRQGRSEADAECIRQGYKSALGKSTLAVLSFGDFARTYAWFASTLRMMAARQEKARDDGTVMPSMPSSASPASSLSTPAEQAKSNGNVPSEPQED